MAQLQQAAQVFFFNLLNYFKPKSPNAELAPTPAWYRAHPPKESIEPTPAPQHAELEELFHPFLRLPLEIRRMIYRDLLIPPSGTIDLLQSWDYSSKARIRFRQQGPWIEWTYTEILRANRQLHDEATPMLYEEGTIHLHIASGLREPFPWHFLRGLEEVNFPHKEGDKLYPETLRRFRRVTLTWLLGAMDNWEPDSRDIMLSGWLFGYSPSEMRAGLSGLKDTLRVLAAPHQEEGEDTDGTVVFPDRESWSLHLDLDWPENVKRVGVIEFDRRWQKEGIWELLAQVGKRRVIQIGRTTDDGEATPWSEIAKCFERLDTTRLRETTSVPDA